MDAHKKTNVDVLAYCNSNRHQGLNSHGVAQSLKKFGANELSAPKKKSIFFKVGSSLLEPMMLILMFAFGITLTVNIIRVFRGESFDVAESIGIFAAIILSVCISLFMERKSEKAFDALKKMGSNTMVKAIRDTKVIEIPSNALVVGDLIKLNVGDKVPVDCRLIASDSLEADESALTGESEPVKKDADKVFSAENPPLAERTNMVYGGTFITGGNALAICVAVGDKTELGTIAKELKTLEATETPLQHKLNTLGKIIALFGAFAAAFVFVVQLTALIATGNADFESIQNVFITSIVLIVAAVPEGLPTIVAVSLALNVIKMSKNRALVKKPAACETIGSVSIICSDKTGTLTENKMTVNEIVTPLGKFAPKVLHAPFIQKNICVNSSADLTQTPNGYSFIGNPTEGALLVAHAQSDPTNTYRMVRQSTQYLKTYPFSTEFKRMTTVLCEDGKRLVLVKGAPEVILSLCCINESTRRHYLKDIASYQAKAKRVIGFAHAYLPESADISNRATLEKNLIFDGFAVLSDPIRKEVYAAVAACKKAGIRVTMLTGDHLTTATAIAKELKITAGEGIFEAHTIEKMSDEALQACVHSIRVVARSTPSIKLRIVKTLKAVGEVVAVTGDGINDAPAIKSADVGIAMGIAGTEVSKEAADIVVLDDSFKSLVTSIKYGRGIYENFQRFMVFQLTVNLAAVMVTVVCILLGIGAPFNTLQLLWINLIMDGPPALTLGLEPIYDGLMHKKPVKRSDNIITGSMMMRIALNGVFIALFVILQAYSNFMGVYADRERTFLFTLFIMFQLFNAFNARELGLQSVFKTFTRNKIMLIVMSIAIVLQIVITQFGGALFGTVALGLSDWLKVFGLSVSIIFFNECYKWIVKRVTQKRETPAKKLVS